MDILRNRLKITFVFVIVLVLSTNIFGAKNESSDLLKKVSQIWGTKKTDKSENQPVAPRVDKKIETQSTPRVQEKKEPVVNKSEKTAKTPLQKTTKISPQTTKLMSVVLTTQKKKVAKTETKNVVKKIKKNRESFAAEFEKYRKAIEALRQQFGKNPNFETVIAKKIPEILEKFPHVKDDVKTVEQFIKTYGAFINPEDADVKELRDYLGQNATIFRGQNIALDKATGRRSTPQNGPRQNSNQPTVTVGGRTFTAQDIKNVTNPQLRSILEKRAQSQGIKLETKPTVVNEASQLATLRDLTTMANQNKRQINSFIEKLGSASLAPDKTKNYVDELVKLLPSSEGQKLIQWQKNGTQKQSASPKNKDSIASKKR